MDEATARPLILTVDDDPSVSRAVARDLRRRYGQEYRIARAESAAEALELLREVKLRGGRVAVLLADYRMPETSGIEFLEAAMDLFPRARRALLTAYADTDAAIAAINVVDVDHYLLKPWEPPDEKLYPVLDAMLAAYADSPDADAADVKVVGHRWSAPSFAVREFLARNAVPYRWVASDSPDGARLLSAAEVGAERLPVVVNPEGVTLVAPTTAELAEAVGLATVPTGDFYDLVVVGGGPAVRRASAPRSTGRRKACGRCWSSVPRRVDRPASPRGSRTIWASRTGSRALSSPTGHGGRRRSSARRS